MIVLVGSSGCGYSQASKEVVIVEVPVVAAVIEVVKVAVCNI